MKAVTGALWECPAALWIIPACTTGPLLVEETHALIARSPAWANTLQPVFERGGLTVGRSHWFPVKDQWWVTTCLGESVALEDETTTVTALRGVLKRATQWALPTVVFPSRCLPETVREAVRRRLYACETPGGPEIIWLL
jgi:hypothetical protein